MPLIKARPGARRKGRRKPCLSKCCRFEEVSRSCQDSIFAALDKPAAIFDMDRLGTFSGSRLIPSHEPVTVYRCDHRSNYKFIDAKVMQMPFEQLVSQLSPTPIITCARTLSAYSSHAFIARLSRRLLTAFAGRWSQSNTTRENAISPSASSQRKPFKVPSTSQRKSHSLSSSLLYLRAWRLNPLSSSLSNMFPWNVWTCTQEPPTGHVGFPALLVQVPIFFSSALFSFSCSCSCLSLFR